METVPNKKILISLLLVVRSTLESFAIRNIPLKAFILSTLRSVTIVAFIFMQGYNKTWYSITWCNSSFNSFAHLAVGADKVLFLSAFSQIKFLIYNLSCSFSKFD